MFQSVSIQTEDFDVSQELQSLRAQDCGWGRFAALSARCAIHAH